MAPRALVLVTLLAACQAPAGGTDGGVRDLGAVDARAGSDAVDSALESALFKEVHAYLTADDPGPSPKLLARLEGVYKGVSFSVLEQAVRAWPSTTFPALGVHKATWTNPLYKGVETYHAYVPAQLAQAAGPRFPLILFLHGAGGDGAGIVGSAAVRKIVDDLGAILVAPTSNAKCDWSLQEDCMSQVVLLVQQLKRRYPVDDARVVLSGFSMGGRGSFSVGVAYPDPYCGVVPVAGTIGAVHNSTDLKLHQAYCCPHVENLGNLRLHYISGDQDVALLLYQNRGCELCLKDLGYDYRYTELKNTGHVWPLDRWEQALKWTLARPRARYPVKVVYNQAAQASSYLPDDLWLQVKLRVPQYWAVLEQRVDETKPARLAATRAGNKISLTSTNVAKAAVYLAGEMLDLGQQVTIELDGAVSFKGVVARDRRLLLTEARRRSERAATFAAVKRVGPGSP